jgi:uncharacterized RDD family membrane protein YckC
MQTVSVNTVFNVNLSFEQANLGKRILAYVIDFVLLAFYAYTFNAILNGSFNSLNSSLNDGRFGGTYITANLLVVCLPMFFYSFLFEKFWGGQTIGKKALNIRVISLEGGNPTTGQFALRWITKCYEWPFLFGPVFGRTTELLVYAIITFIFGTIVLIIIAISKKGQRFGDIFADTTVVNVKTKLNVFDTVFRAVSANNYTVKHPEVMRLSDRDINTIKNVLEQAQKTKHYDNVNRVAQKIVEILDIKTNLESDIFLEQLILDYNYLATNGK